jgi:polysaccharide pyruvyl transferase CsaB
MARHTLLSGYYGFDNLGDELIGAVLLHALATPVAVHGGATNAQRHGQSVQPVMLTMLRLPSAMPFSEHPLYKPLVAHPYATLKSCPRWSLPKILKALWQCDRFVSGGGGLLQDTTGAGSIIYYGGLCLLAKLMGKHVWIAFQGLGPIRTPWLRWFTGAVLRSCDAILLRDRESVTLARTLAGCKIPVTLVPDSVWAAPSFGLLPDFSKNTVITQPTSFEGHPFRLGVSLRTWHTLDTATVQNLAKSILKTAHAQGIQHLTIVGLSFQVAQDTPVLESLQKALEALQKTVYPELTLRYEYHHESLLTELPKLHALVAMRFHALVLGLLCGLPVAILPYAPKLSSLAQRLGLTCHQWQPDAQAPVSAALWKPLPETTHQQVTHLTQEATQALKTIAY